jgi:hypothetical protein
MKKRRKGEKDDKKYEKNEDILKKVKYGTVYAKEQYNGTGEKGAREINTGGGG